MNTQEPSYPLGNRPPPLRFAKEDAERTLASPVRTARQRSYTSTASLENDREGDYERESLGSDYGGGAATAREDVRHHVAGMSGQRQERILSTDTVVHQSPTDTTFSAETIKINSLTLRDDGLSETTGKGDATPRGLTMTAEQRRKSSAASTSTVARSRTLPRMRRSSNTDSQEDEDQTDTPTKPRRASPRRNPSSSSLLDPTDRYHGAPSGSRRHSYRKNTSRFVDPDVAAKMKRWVQEIVVCNFDLDRGPVVERRMTGRPWAKGEKANMQVLIDL